MEQGQNPFHLWRQTGEYLMLLRYLVPIMFLIGVAVEPSTVIAYTLGETGALSQHYDLISKSDQVFVDLNPSGPVITSPIGGKVVAAHEYTVASPKWLLVTKPFRLKEYAFGFFPHPLGDFTEGQRLPIESAIYDSNGSLIYLASLGCLGDCQDLPMSYYFGLSHGKVIPGLLFRQDTAQRSEVLVQDNKAQFPSDTLEFQSIAAFRSKCDSCVDHTLTFVGYDNSGYPEVMDSSPRGQSEFTLEPGEVLKLGAFSVSYIDAGAGGTVSFRLSSDRPAFPGP